MCARLSSGRGVQGRFPRTKDAIDLFLRSDAANAKVAELRTMVGERYRDLLAAADSIVRMRSAAEKLVDKLDTVQMAVSAADSAATGQSDSSWREKL